MGRHSMDEQLDVGGQAEQDDNVDLDLPETPGLHRAPGPLFDVTDSASES